MWSSVIVFLTLFSSTIFGFENVHSTFSLDYFKEKGVKSVCLFTCDDDKQIVNFVKDAAKLSIRVSVVKYDGSTKVGSCLQQQYSSIGVLSDPTCPSFNQIMYYASVNTLLDSRHKWLLIIDNNQESLTNTTFTEVEGNNAVETIKVVSELNISVDADVLLALKNKACEEYDLLDLYNFGKIQGGDLIVEKIASWTPETGFSQNINEYKYYRRWNFNQWPMKMISVVSPAPKVFDPKMILDLNPTVGVGTITKISFTILQVISEIHNVRFVHSIADRWVDDYGINTSKAVVASSLYYRQQDVSPLIRSIKEVHEKIDLAHPPLVSIETRYFYRIPTYGAGKLENQFLRPLSTGAWLSVVAISAICALVLLLSAKMEKRPSSGQYAIFSVIASICQQFFDENTNGTERESAARKLTVLVTGISCVLIYNYYTSSVVSWLLNGPPPSINSLQELLESPLELIFEDIGYTHSWLQTPSYYYNRRNARIEDELKKKKVFNKKKDAPLLMSVEEGIGMVKAGGFAYHTEVDSANRLISKTFTQSELCELGSLHSMEKTMLYPCLQKNSPYKEFFVWSLMRLLERGIVKCIQKRIVSPSVQCEGSSPRALALGGAAPAFLLLAAGYFLATVIMLIERFIWQYKDRPMVFRKNKKFEKLTRQHYKNKTKIENHIRMK